MKKHTMTSKYAQSLTSVKVSENTAKHSNGKKLVKGTL